MLQAKNLLYLLLKLAQSECERTFWNLELFNKHLHVAALAFEQSEAAKAMASDEHCKKSEFALTAS